MLWTVTDHGPLGAQHRSFNAAAQSSAEVKIATLRRALETIPDAFAKIPASTGGFRDDMRYACAVAECVLPAFGLRLPNVEITWRAEAEAYSKGDTIYIRPDFAARAGVQLLVEVLLHEAGHILDGHTDPRVMLTQHAMVQRGMISPQAFISVQHEREFVADTYAAVGAWLLGDTTPNGPAIARWFEGMRFHGASVSHPSPAERARRMRLVFANLDQIHAQVCGKKN